MPDRAWYYASGGQQRGPVKTAQLKQLATAGELKPDDLVWCDGMANWSPASTVKGLFAADASRTADAVSSSPATAATLPHEATDSAKSSPASDQQYREQLQSARQFATQASREAAGAFKSLMADPIGGLAPCFQSLGKTRALQVGAAFIAVYFVLWLVASIIGFSLPGLPLSAEQTVRVILRMLVLAVAMTAALVGVSALFRMLTKSGIGVEADLFIVGAGLLPMGLAAFLSSILRIQSEIVLVLVMIAFVFAATFTTLILYMGQTAIVRHTPRMGAVAVATMLCAAMVAAWIVGKII
jgi:hypothetical protein